MNAPASRPPLGSHAGRPCEPRSQPTRGPQRRAGDVAGVGEQQDLNEAFERLGDRDHAAADRTGHAHAVVTELTLAAEPAACRTTVDAKRGAEPAALGRPARPGALVIAACACMGSARAGAADRGIDACPAMRIAARSASAAGMVRPTAGIGRRVLQRRRAGIERDHVDSRRAMRRGPPLNRLAAGSIGQGVDPGVTRCPVAPGPAKRGTRAVVAHWQRAVPVAACSPASEDLTVLTAGDYRDHRVELVVALGHLMGSGGVLERGARDAGAKLLGERPLAGPIVGHSVGGSALDEALATRLAVEGAHRGALIAGLLRALAEQAKGGTVGQPVRLVHRSCSLAARTWPRALNIPDDALYARRSHGYSQLAVSKALMLSVGARSGLTLNPITAGRAERRGGASDP